MHKKDLTTIKSLTLIAMLHECDQMVSYNSSNLIKNRFIDWKPYEFDHTYTMRSVGEYMQEQNKRKRTPAS